jgi:hypothetical protein
MSKADRFANRFAPRVSHLPTPAHASHAARLDSKRRIAHRASFTHDERRERVVWPRKPPSRGRVRARAPRRGRSKTSCDDDDDDEKRRRSASRAKSPSSSFVVRARRDASSPRRTLLRAPRAAAAAVARGPIAVRVRELPRDALAVVRAPGESPLERAEGRFAHRQRGEVTTRGVPREEATLTRRRRDVSTTRRDATRVRVK